MNTQNLVIADGLWRSAGQPPRSLALGVPDKGGCMVPGVVFNDMDVAGLHGQWCVLSNRDDMTSPILPLAFFHQNFDCSRIQQNKLFWKKAGVWITNDNQEAFIVLGAQTDAVIQGLRQFRMLKDVMQVPNDMVSEIAFKFGMINVEGEGEVK